MLYVCISADVVARVAAPGKVRCSTADTIPVSVIGRLAVDRGHALQGLGTELLTEMRCGGLPSPPKAAAWRLPWCTRRMMPPDGSICAAPSSSNTLRTTARCFC